MNGFAKSKQLFIYLNLENRSFVYTMPKRNGRPENIFPGTNKDVYYFQGIYNRNMTNQQRYKQHPRGVWKSFIFISGEMLAKYSPPIIYIWLQSLRLRKIAVLFSE